MECHVLSWSGLSCRPCRMPCRGGSRLPGARTGRRSGRERSWATPSFRFGSTAMPARHRSDPVSRVSCARACAGGGGRIAPARLARLIARARRRTHFACRLNRGRSAPGRRGREAAPDASSPGPIIPLFSEMQVRNKELLLKFQEPFVWYQRSLTGTDVSNRTHPAVAPAPEPGPRTALETRRSPGGMDPGSPLRSVRGDKQGCALDTVSERTDRALSGLACPLHPAAAGLRIGARRRVRRGCGRSRGPGRWSRAPRGRRRRAG